MAMINVRLFATFRLLAGIKSLELDLPPGATVMNAVLEIVNQYPMLKPHWLGERDELHAHVHILLEGEDVTTLAEGLQTVLKPGETLDFFPPVAGG